MVEQAPLPTEQHEGGEENRIDVPLIASLKRELESQVVNNQRLLEDMQDIQTKNLLLRQMVDFNKWQEAQKDNDLHRENVRLQQEVVKRDALIDLLGRELDNKQ